MPRPQVTERQGLFPLFVGADDGQAGALPSILIPGRLMPPGEKLEKSEVPRRTLISASSWLATPTACLTRGSLTRFHTDAAECNSLCSRLASASPWVVSWSAFCFASCTRVFASESRFLNSSLIGINPHRKRADHACASALEPLVVKAERACVCPFNGNSRFQIDPFGTPRLTGEGLFSVRRVTIPRILTRVRCARPSPLLSAIPVINILTNMLFRETVSLLKSCLRADPRGH